MNLQITGKLKNLVIWRNESLNIKSYKTSFTSESLYDLIVKLFDGSSKFNEPNDFAIESVSDIRVKITK